MKTFKTHTKGTGLCRADHSSKLNVDDSSAEEMDIVVRRRPFLEKPKEIAYVISYKEVKTLAEYR